MYSEEQKHGQIQEYSEEKYDTTYISLYNYNTEYYKIFLLIISIILLIIFVIMIIKKYN